jgi:hypothetical protein
MWYHMKTYTHLFLNCIIIELLIIFFLISHASLFVIIKLKLLLNIKNIAKDEL